MIEMSRPALARTSARCATRRCRADHLFGRRLEMLTLAVLGQLRAHGELAPDRARVDLRRRAGDRAGPRRRPSSTRAPRRVRDAARPRLRLRSLVALLVGAAFARASRSTRLAVGRRACATGSTAPAPPAPLVFIALSALLTVALFPGPLLAGASGLLFGTALGTPVSIVVGDARRVAGLLARRAGGRTTPSSELAGPRLRALRDVDRRAAASSSVLYARIAPGVPYSLVNYAAGLTPIRAARRSPPPPRSASRRARSPTPRSAASLGDLGSPEAIVASRAGRDGVVGAASAGATCAGARSRSDALDLEQARRARACPHGRPAVMPTRSPRLAPAELDDARARRRRSAPR